VNKEDFDKLIQKTEEQVEDRQKFIGMKLIDNRTSIKEKYPYRTTKLDPPILHPKVYGFTQDYFGGNVSKIAKIRNSPWCILVDKNDNTLALFLPVESIKELKYDELKEQCNRYKIHYEANATKAQLIEALTNIFS
jgi:hypothetical protein